MAEYSNQGRVFGKTVGRMTEGTRTANYSRFPTEEAKAEAQRQTQASYETWKAQRDARIANSRMTRVRELRHKDIIV